MENMCRSEEENESSEQVVLEEEEEYVLLDLDRVSPHLQIPPNAPYVLSGLDTPNPILIIDGKIKLIGKYEETMGTCLIFNEHDGGPVVHEEMGPSEANLFAGRYIMDPLQKPSKRVNPVARLHKELLAIQQQGPRSIGFFGTRNMGFMHQELIEILSYALVITKNHIFTSGASGTNAAVIRGALRAEKPELLTVILPQSLKKQPPESQELLSKVQNVVEKPHNDHLPLIEASRLCNMDIISKVQQVICFAFHDSRLLMETCQEAKNMRKIVTLFYLD